ncbi:MAG TPA: hypothetical protein PKJ45_15740, partial [Rubrivivax sp.]|nr:hypothetical protein [Rubrivivax sp.]
MSKPTLTTSHGATKPNALVNSASTPTLTSPPDHGHPLPAWMQPLSVLGSTRNDEGPFGIGVPHILELLIQLCFDYQRGISFLATSLKVQNHQRMAKTCCLQGKNIRAGRAYTTITAHVGAKRKGKRPHTQSLR